MLIVTPVGISPFDFDVVAAREPAAEIAGPGGDEYVVGPGAVT